MAVGLFVLVCVGVGVFVYQRKQEKHPVRFASTATVRVAQSPQAQPKSNARVTTTSAPAIPLSGPAQLAMQQNVRNAALAASNLPPNDARVGFTATINETQDIVALNVVAPTRPQAFTVAKQWTNAFLVARNADAARQVTEQTNDLKRTINSVHDRLFVVDLQLAKLLPNQFNKLLTYDLAGNSARDNNGSTVAAPPPLCEICNTSVYLLNRWTERLQLIDKLVNSSNDLAAIQVQNATPGAFGQALAQTPGTRITTPVNTWLPALIALLIGLLLSLAAAVLVDRLDSRIRDPEDAASAFGAPVLSVLPWESEQVDVVSRPDSEAAENYRALAALSIATDRLPRAVMVTSPTGDAYGEVAANFAAALSGLGLKVALIATSPHEDWYLNELNGMSLDKSTHIRLPELLSRAHTGTLVMGLGGTALAVADKAPNLVVVPPTDQPMARMPVDGLPPFLNAIADSGVDVTVVAGPPILENADATIVAWTTRSVLWAIAPGETTKAQARSAAARMELTGVTSFGVVMIAPRRNGAWRQ